MNNLEESIFSIIKHNHTIEFLEIVRYLSGEATQEEVAKACVKLQNQQVISSAFNSLVDPTLFPERTVYKVNN